MIQQDTTNAQKATDKNRRIWEHPWKYREGFVIALGLFIAGLCIHIATGKQAPQISFPVNVITGFAFLTLLVFSKLLFPKHKLVVWLSGIPAAISSISLLTFMVLLMGVFPQTSVSHNQVVNFLGFNDIISHWAFLLALLFFLATLGFAALKRTIPFKTKNIGFILNHAGLWLTIFAAILGSGDVKRLRMRLHEDGDYSNIVTKNKEVYQLPFTVKLVDFEMETYPPKLALINNKNQIMKCNKKVCITDVIQENTDYVLNHYVISIEKLLPLAQINEKNEYIASEKRGSAPAAMLTVYRDGEPVAQGWVSSGSFLTPRTTLSIPDNSKLVMLEPEAKKYNSHIKIKDKNGRVTNTNIVVNEPHKYENWNIYQIDYNAKAGKWSKISVLELVSDPWLPIVYTGIFMLFGGAAYMFWVGQQRKP